MIDTSGNLPSLGPRAVTWVVQIGVQTLAFALLILLIGADARFTRIGLTDVVSGFVAVSYILFITGYSLTTLLVRLFLARLNKW